MTATQFVADQPHLVLLIASGLTASSYAAVQLAKQVLSRTRGSASISWQPKDKPA